MGCGAAWAAAVAAAWAAAWAAAAVGGMRRHARRARDERRGPRQGLRLAPDEAACSATSGPTRSAPASASSPCSCCRPRNIAQPLPARPRDRPDRARRLATASWSSSALLRDRLRSSAGWRTYQQVLPDDAGSASSPCTTSPATCSATSPSSRCSFFDHNETGRIMARVQSDVNVLQNLLSQRPDQHRRQHDLRLSASSSSMFVDQLAPRRADLDRRPGLRRWRSCCLAGLRAPQLPSGARHDLRRQRQPAGERQRRARHPEPGPRGRELAPLRPAPTPPTSTPTSAPAASPPPRSPSSSSSSAMSLGARAVLRRHAW